MPKIGVPEIPGYITTQEAAKIIGIPEGQPTGASFIKSLVNRGFIPLAVGAVDGKKPLVYLWKKDEVEKFNEVTPVHARGAEGGYQEIWKRIIDLTKRVAFLEGELGVKAQEDAHTP